MSRRAVLLLNLGSPDSTAVPDVKRYLREFLGDERVIDRPAQPFRWLLVNGIIVPFRAAKSAHAYSRVWTSEGSPLVATRRRTQSALRQRTAVTIALAMNYGRPSIIDVLRELAAAGIDELLLFPQYPHYAMSSWETVVAKVYRVAAHVAPDVKIASIQPYFADDDYIDALVASARPHLAQPHDHLLFSYHGLPVRHLTKADSSRSHCQLVPDCCQTCSPAHATCYKAQITRTSHLFAQKAGLDPAKWSISFQSRLVGEPWLQPYTDYEFKRLAGAGRKRLLVITPAFVTDCLETLEEIRMAGEETFLHAGGETFTHIPCLNDQPVWIDFLTDRVRRWAEAAPARSAPV
jgi:ferrochelatase